MIPSGPIEMQETVALGAQRAAGATLYDGDCWAVVVVGAVRARLRRWVARPGLPPFTGPVHSEYNDDEY